MTSEEIEQTFQRVAIAIEQLMQMAVRAEERQDTADSARRAADERLDALIDAQAQLTHRVDTLTSDIAAHNGRVERTDERLDRIAEMIEALTHAQARTDEQIRLLVARNSATKPKRKAAKKTGVKKASKKISPKK